MSRMNTSNPRAIQHLLCLLVLWAPVVTVRAQESPQPHHGNTPAKLSLYGLRITPSGVDAREFSKAGWGGGGRGVVSPPVLSHGLGVALGFDVANLLDQTTVVFDPLTHLRVEQNTSQYLVRLALGGEIGPHGHGFFRPFAGANLVLHVYSIDATVTIPDDNDPSRSIQQNLGSETHAAFGYDLTLGTDLQVRRYFVEGGMRFLKSFRVPQQLGRADAVFIHPGYLQVFVGVGLTVW